MTQIKVLNKRFMLVSPTCYNILIVEATSKEEALKEAKQVMLKLDKFEDFEITNVIELYGNKEDKTFIYRGTDNVKDIWVEQLEKEND